MTKRSKQPLFNKTAAVKDYYSKNVAKEWNRLQRNAFNRLEYITTIEYLKKYLPKKGRVLDAGSGPGRYSIALARLGYQMTLLDLTPSFLRKAAKEAKNAGVNNLINAYIVGDLTRDLEQFHSAHFDAILCLGGALSHIVEKRKRLKVIKELTAAAKPGSFLFFSVIGRLGAIQNSIESYPHEFKEGYFKRYRDTGNYFGGTGFPPTHFFRLQDFQDLITQAGLKIKMCVGLEGLASGNPKGFARNFKSKDRWNTWLETHFKTCEIPAVVEISPHMLIVARKPSN